MFLYFMCKINKTSYHEYLLYIQKVPRILFKLYASDLICNGVDRTVNISQRISKYIK